MPRVKDPSLDEFVEECRNPKWDRTLPRAWIEDGPVRFYLRRAEHVLDSVGVPTLDLANGGVLKEERGKGHFTAFLERVEQAAKSLGRRVYVENVLNPILADFLRRRGYLERGHEECPCFWSPE